MKKPVFVAVGFLIICSCNLLFNPDFSISVNNSGISIDQTIDFGRVEVGSRSVSIQFTLANQGLSDLHLSGNPMLELTGTGADQFIPSQPETATVKPGNSTSFSCTFAPETAGESRAVLSFQTNDPDYPVFSINVLGYGYNDAGLQLSFDSAVYESGSVISLGDISTDSEGVDVYLSVRNPGQSDVPLQAAAVADNCQWLSVSGFMEIILSPDESLALQLHVVPPETEGTQTCELSIETADDKSSIFIIEADFFTPPQPELSVALNGTSVSSSNTVTLPYTPGGQARDLTVTVSNTGSAELAFENTDPVELLSMLNNNFTGDFNIINLPDELDLAPGSSFSFTLRVMPQISSPSMSDAIVFSSNAEPFQFDFEVNAETEMYFTFYQSEYAEARNRSDTLLLSDQYEEYGYWVVDLPAAVPTAYFTLGEPDSSAALYWSLPDYSDPLLSPLRPPYRRAIFDADSLFYTIGAGYDYAGETDLFYRYWNPDTGSIEIISELDIIIITTVGYTEAFITPISPDLSYLSVIREKESPDLSPANTDPNSHLLLDLDTVLNGTDTAYGSVGSGYESLPVLFGHTPQYVGGRWGFYTTWRSNADPVMEEVFIPYNDPQQPAYDGLSTVSCWALENVFPAADSYWVLNEAGEQTRYAFYRTKLFTVNEGETAVSSAESVADHDFLINGDIFGDVSFVLRKPDGSRILIGEAHGTDTAHVLQDLTTSISLTDFNQSGDYWLETYASWGVFSPTYVQTLVQDFEAESNQLIHTDGSAPVMFHNLTFGGKTWEVADYSLSDYGVPEVCGQIAAVTEGSSTNRDFVVMTSSAVDNYTAAVTMGKKASDNDELRFYVRLSGSGNATPEEYGTGLYLFINPGGDPWNNDRTTDKIGVSYLQDGSETVLISDVQDEGMSNRTSSQLASWFAENGFSLTTGSADYLRVRAVCEDDTVIFYLSPANPADPDSAIDLTNLGPGPGQTLDISITDTVGSLPVMGIAALEYVSQIGWFDNFVFEPAEPQHGIIQTPYDPYNHSDPYTVNINYTHQDDLLSIARYTVEGEDIYDNFGDGYSSAGRAVSTQVSNNDNDPWATWDNYDFIDYVIDPAVERIPVASVNSLPVYGPNKLCQNIETPDGTIRLICSRELGRQVSFSFDLECADGSRDYDFIVYARYMNLFDNLNVRLRPDNSVGVAVGDNSYLASPAGTIPSGTTHFYINFDNTNREITVAESDTAAPWHTFTYAEDSEIDMQMLYSPRYYGFGFNEAVTLDNVLVDWSAY